VEMMKLKIDITMNLYPWIEMIVFSELCAFGPLSHAAQPFQIILKQKCKLKLKNMEYGYCQVLSSKKAKCIYNTASVINPQGEVVTRYRKCFHFILMKQG
jgi:predicted amidohydrolase